MEEEGLFSQELLGLDQIINPEIEMVETIRNLMVVPTVLRIMMHAVENPKDRYDLALRSITAGGETLGEELYDWSRSGLGVELNEQYGLTCCIK